MSTTGPKARASATSRRYPSDLTDVEWALLAPLLPPPKPTGRAQKWSDRPITDAIFCVLRSGCAWRYGLEEKPAHTFRVLPRRWAGAPWAGERTFAWLGQSRRLIKDYERLPAVSEAMIHGAMSRLMLRRLAQNAAQEPSKTMFRRCVP